MTRAGPPRPVWGLGRPAGVLLGLGVLGVASALLPPYSHHVRSLVAGLVLFPVVTGLYVECVRRDRRSWVDSVAPWLTFVLVVLLRHGAGGDMSGLAVLVAIPISWLALYGTRRDLAVGTVLTALTLIAPIVLVGAPEYPASGWRPIVIWLGVAALLAPLVQHALQRNEIAAVEVDVRSRELAGTLDGILYGATTVGLVTVDPEGRVLSMGAGAEQLTRRSAGDVVGQDLMTLFADPGQLEGVAADLRVEPGFDVLSKLARLGAPSRIWALHGGEGAPVAARVGVSELHDELGDLLGYLVVFADETHAEQARAELGEAEERWRVLLDHLPDTTVVLVEEGSGILVVTGALARGVRQRDSAGRWLQDLADDAKVPLDRMLAEAFAGREPGRHHDARADLSDHEFQISPLPALHGRGRALVVVRDVSRDRRRQRAITVAKERAERLFANAPNGVALLTPEAVILQANPALGRILGRHDLEGITLSSLSFHDGDSTVQHHLDALLSGASPHSSAQWTVRRPDGSEAHVVLSSTVLSGQEGELDQVLTNVVDVSERYRYEQQLAHLANHDPLTGLANRRHFDLELARHVDHCRRYGAAGALLVLDLDHFKEVNDSLGHATGDELLVQVAEILRGRLRTTDVVARLGGDEFAVLLPQSDQKATEAVARGIVEEVHRQLGSLADTRSNVTVSIGGATVPADVRTASELLSTADAAMYRAKAAGRNQYVLHPDSSAT